MARRKPARINVYLYAVSVEPKLTENGARIDIELNLFKKFSVPLEEYDVLPEVVEREIGFFEKGDTQYIIETNEVVEEIRKRGKRPLNFHGLVIGPFTEDGMLRPPYPIDELLFFLYFEIIGHPIEDEYYYDERKIIANKLLQRAFSAPLF